MLSRVHSGGMGLPVKNRRLGRGVERSVAMARHVHWSMSVSDDAGIPTLITLSCRAIYRHRGRQISRVRLCRDPNRVRRESACSGYRHRPS